MQPFPFIAISTINMCPTPRTFAYSSVRLFTWSIWCKGIKMFAGSTETVEKSEEEEEWSLRRWIGWRRDAWGEKWKEEDKEVKNYIFLFAREIYYERLQLTSWNCRNRRDRLRIEIVFKSGREFLSNLYSLLSPYTISSRCDISNSSLSLIFVENSR